MSDSFISRSKSITVSKPMQIEYPQKRQTHWIVEFKLKQKENPKKKQQINEWSSFYFWWRREKH